MFVQGQGGVQGEDYAFYAVIVLDSNGWLWFDIGAWVDHEYTFPTPTCTLDFSRTWLIQGVDLSTPILLTMYWDEGSSKTIFWKATINGQDYPSSGNSFDEGQVHPDIAKGFYVGMYRILGGWWPWSWWCYYFQFGIISPQQVTQGGWQVHLSSPQYFAGGSWQNVAMALSTV